MDPSLKADNSSSRYVYTGLCGNYNGVEDDDFLASNGVVEGKVVDFASSWALDDCRQASDDDETVSPEEVCIRINLAHFI